MRRLSQGLILGWLASFFALPLFAQEPPHSESPANLLFRDQFYLSPRERVRHKTTPINNFLVLEQPAPEWNSNIALVSDFAPKAVRTRALKDVQTLEQAREWLGGEKKEFSFEGVPVIELSLPLADGSVRQRYWVGNKSFSSFDKAAAEIAMVQSIVQSQGGDFARAVALAEEFKEAEPAPPRQEEVKTRAQFEREEEIALRWADQLDIGEKLWGPFQGVPAGEPILFQSFGETTWRSTNLAERSFRSVVGSWTNQLIFKGIRFPINTINPILELTVAPESNGNDGASKIITAVGLEWRPLQRNAWLENFRPWGIPLLIWAKNYRFYVAYGDERNLKDEIANIRDFDFRWGVDIFYEWGIDLPPPDRGPNKGFVGFLEDYTWGEYFGKYDWRDTNFTAEENFDAWILDTSLMLGFKVPLVNLPPNPVNDQLMLMPYFRLGLIYNTRLSNPADNRYFVAVGLRWMPFRDYRFSNNEWLFKTKVFAEWLGIGKVQNFHADDSRPWPDEDWRIGVAWSLRRS